MCIASTMYVAQVACLLILKNSSQNIFYSVHLISLKVKHFLQILMPNFMARTTYFPFRLTLPYSVYLASGWVYIAPGVVYIGCILHLG